MRVRHFLAIRISTNWLWGIGIQLNFDSSMRHHLLWRMTQNYVLASITFYFHCFSTFLFLLLLVLVNIFSPLLYTVDRLKLLQLVLQVVRASNPLTSRSINNGTTGYGSTPSEHHESKSTIQQFNLPSTA